MILKNCRLIPQLCEGIPSETADIRVEGDTIAEITSCGSWDTAGEDVIDCRNMTVLPGLFNIHVHLFHHRGSYSQHVHFMHCMKYANTLLSYGFTSIRDMGSPYNIAISMRDMIHSGELTGPDIKACGYVLSPNGPEYPPLDVYSHQFGRPVDSVAQARQEARRQLAEGADFLKILGDGAMGTGTRRGKSFILLDDEFQAICEIAALEGTYVAAHTNSTVSTMKCIKAEIHSIEHGHFLEQQDVDAIVAHGYKSAIVPTVHVCTRWGEDYARNNVEGLRMAYDAGVLLGWGTDAMEQEFRTAAATEWIYREKLLGFSRIELLKQATINSAKINGTDDLRGSIKVGKRADFAIFDGRPDEDLMLFNAPCAIVIKDGKIVAQNGWMQI